MKKKDVKRAGPLWDALGEGGSESNLSCCEEVLIRVNEKLQIPNWSLGYGVWNFSKTFLKVASGFGGGVGGRGSICGALSGGVMALGLVFGTDGTEDENTFYRKRKETKLIVKELISTFEQKFGATNCSDLLGCYAFWTDEGKRKYNELKAAKQLKCSDYIKFTSQLVILLIENKV